MTDRALGGELSPSKTALAIFALGFALTSILGNQPDTVSVVLIGALAVAIWS
jgi:hypothetical protein